MIMYFANRADQIPTQFKNVDLNKSDVYVLGDEILTFVSSTDLPTEPLEQALVNFVNPLYEKMPKFCCFFHEALWGLQLGECMKAVFDMRARPVLH